MKRKNVFGILLMLSCMAAFVSCSQETDTDDRGFMSQATVAKSKEGKYLCYLDGGGIVTSKSAVLDGIERGYFAFMYKEYQRKTSGKKELFIDDAVVAGFKKYRVAYPLTIKEAKERGITDPENSEENAEFLLSGVCRGFFDVVVGTSVRNRSTGEVAGTKVYLVYDPGNQTPNTLMFKLYRNPGVSKTWTAKEIVKETVSYDISSLYSLQNWADSVTIIVDGGEEIQPFKISRNDFIKPDINIDLNN
ncbi:hypothetical protein HQ29_01475 [Porphyromonas canoris]|uniref:hypothetical protein n=1 Tax=Porphyromonas TaxID=836 RepID=UPI00051DEC66|nr:MULTISPECIES: hypothetical protein [Porphyromonas]KGL53630.1 hypothetical protein HQ29_01475 [Porphyromonas canoris]KGN95129.1 hypothetical protein HQ39_06300 [Porphyromonas sp. COT-108 OH2963]